MRDDFLFRLTWAPGTIALWDNRCTLHCPLNDYAGQRRVGYRIITSSAEGRSYAFGADVSEGNQRLDAMWPSVDAST